MKKKPSFFERLTGSVTVDESDFDFDEPVKENLPEQTSQSWVDEEVEGQLAVDVHQTEDSVIVKTMTAGVNPDDVEITLSRDTITIRGKRHSEHEIKEHDFFHRELYWGSFSRTIILPCEVEAEEATAKADHGLLTITLPKVDKNRQIRIKVK